MSSLCQKSTDEDLIGGAQLDYFGSRSFRVVLFFQRTVVLVIFVVAHRFSKYKMRTNPESAVLILPSYFEFVYCLVAVNIFFETVNIIATASGIFSFISSMFSVIDVVVIMFFRLSLSFFYLQSGAGTKDVRKAAQNGAIGAAVILFIVGAASLCKINGNIEAGFSILAAATFAALILVLIVFLLPQHMLYRRPAINPVCVGSIFSISWLLINNFLGYYQVNYSSCSVVAHIFVFGGIIEPVLLLYSLYIDSNVSPISLS
jgi:hypothetical protein